MSEENVEVLRRIYGEWGRGNFREGAELYDPQVLLVVRSSAWLPGRACTTAVMRSPGTCARYSFPSGMAW
jgi:hypothetical protein